MAFTLSSLYLASIHLYLQTCQSESTKRLAGYEQGFGLIKLDVVGLGLCDMMYVCINCSKDINTQQPHIATFLPPDPFLHDEAHYLGKVGRGREVDSILFVLYVEPTASTFSCIA